MNNHEFGLHDLVEGKRDIISKYRKLWQVWQNKKMLTRGQSSTVYLRGWLTASQFSELKKWDRCFLRVKSGASIQERVKGAEQIYNKVIKIVYITSV